MRAKVLFCQSYSVMVTVPLVWSFILSVHAPGFGHFQFHRFQKSTGKRMIDFLWHLRGTFEKPKLLRLIKFSWRTKDFKAGKSRLLCDIPARQCREEQRSLEEICWTVKVCWNMNDLTPKCWCLTFLIGNLEPWMNESSANYIWLFESNYKLCKSRWFGGPCLRRPLGGWQMRRKAVPRLGACCVSI